LYDNVIGVTVAVRSVDGELSLWTAGQDTVVIVPARQVVPAPEPMRTRVVCKFTSVENLALLSSVLNDSLPFMVGQSHDSFTVPGVKDNMLYQHCQQALNCCARGTYRRHSEANLAVK
jgi:hypothetical protein